MRNVYLLTCAVLMTASASAQPFNFPVSVDFNTNYAPTTVVMPPSPLKSQILFVGSVDMVQTTATYGNPATSVPAKEWHDFIGFTPDNTASGDLGWVVVNHEMLQANNNIGDGGGMTAFKVKRDPNTDTLMIVNQTLTDGRTGKFFNVDFANTVGETGMNCGGIVGPDGRIWTAEEWWIDDNYYLYSAFGASAGAGVRDTADFTIANTGIAVADGKTIHKYQNFNWMVEVDARQAKAVRKQYNWGRQPFEGGAFLPDNKTVILGADDTPGFLTKFVADQANDFTKGKLYVYKHDAWGKWIEIDNTVWDNMLNFGQAAAAAGATMFNRLEWVAYDPQTDAVYFTETGRDKPGSAFTAGAAAGAVYAPHHVTRAIQQGTTPSTSAYHDYYGRVLKLELFGNEITTFLEGGPYFAADTVKLADYPATHLSNPDGLSVARINGKSFLVIQEDLNGSSHGRIPWDVTSSRTCELFMLDMAVSSPTVNDLVRITIVPKGAEITGAIFTPDGKTLLVNSQHPSSGNPYPYNHSLTYAITGWDAAVVTGLFNPSFDEADDFAVFPNPATRELRFKEAMDVALYNAKGQRILVARNATRLDVSNLPAGVYFVRNLEGKTKQVIIQQ